MLIIFIECRRYILNHLKTRFIGFISICVYVLYNWNDSYDLYVMHFYRMSKLFIESFINLILRIYLYVCISLV